MITMKRIYYKKTLEEPNKLIVYDEETGETIITNKFTQDNCTVNVEYGNSQGAEKRCGAKAVMWVKPTVFKIMVWCP